MMMPGVASSRIEIHCDLMNSRSVARLDIGSQRPLASAWTVASCARPPGKCPAIVRDSFSNRSVVPPVVIRFAISMFRTAFPKDKRSLT